MLPLWTFKSYISTSERVAIVDWYRVQTDAVQGAFDVVLEFLEQRERDEWRRPDFDLLAGKMRGIGEVRFRADRTQFRILGFFGPSRNEFTILVPAQKKGQNYDPREALGTALKRRDEVMSNGARANVFAL